MTTPLATDIRKRFRMSSREPDVHAFGPKDEGDEALLPTDQEIDLMKALIHEGTFKPPLITPIACSYGGPICRIAWIDGKFQSIVQPCDEGDEDSAEDEDDDEASEKKDWDNPTVSSDIPETNQFARSQFGEEVQFMFEAASEPVVHINDIEIMYWMIALAQANEVHIEFPI